jgi:hypothetical protein
VVEIEMHLYLGKRIITLSPAMHIKLTTTVHAKSHNFLLLLQISYFLIYYLLHCTHFPCAMASEADQTLLTTGDAAAVDTKMVSGMESDTVTTSSSSNVAVVKIVKKDVPMLTDYWKKSIVTDADHAAYHAAGWLLGGVESATSNLEFPLLDNTAIVCFESHLIVGLVLPPSKFLVSILNFLWCELVHLNSNAIAALSCFTMLCECWLRFPPNTSLFWYSYGLVPV